MARRGLFAAISLRVALGARPHGATRRDDAAGALERLEAGAVHKREHQARLRLAEASFANLVAQSHKVISAGLRGRGEPLA